MKRRLLTILAVVSLIISIATASLWVRSYWISDMLAWHRSDFRWFVGLSAVRGTLVLSVSHHEQPHMQALDNGWHQRQAKQILLRPPKRSWQCLGFMLGGGSSAESWSWTVAIPLWSILLLSAVIPLRWLLSFLRVRRAKRRGLCRRCRYDLTGNVSGVCPECGQPVPDGQTGSPKG